MRFFVFLILLLIPISVFSQENTDLRIIIEDTDNDVVDIIAPGGSKHNFLINIKNEGEQDVELLLYVESDEKKGRSLQYNTRFYDIAQNDLSETLLASNENNVALLCEKKDLDEKIVNWCNGEGEFFINVEADQSYTIPMVNIIDPMEIDHEAQLILLRGKQKDQGVPIKKFTLKYRAPKKDISKVAMSSYSVEKKFGPFSVVKWINANLKEIYRAQYIIANDSLKNVEVTYFSTIKSEWIGESVLFEKKELIQAKEKRNVALDLTMPRFGKVNIQGGIKYTDNEGNEQLIESENINFIVWPATLILLIFGAGCFCVITVLLYKYINKNMFEFIKRKKSKKQESVFTGTYVVKDADNIISIAQQYDVPWKELAKINNIDPPYVLISGETIHVPAQENDEQEAQHKGLDSENLVSKKESEDLIDQNMTDAGEASAIKMDLHTDPNGIKNIAAEDAYGDDPMIVEQKNDPVEKNGVGKKEENIPLSTEPKKRKVTFASPKNMLKKPSSEPTTRAIDIEWMRDDEVAYLEEMEVQEKKTNRALIVVFAIIIAIIVALAWWGITWLSKKTEKNNVSVDTLIEERAQEFEQNELDSDLESGEKNTDIPEQTNEEAEQPEKEEIAKSEVTIQVLNAGAPSGSANSVTKEFEDLGYKIKEAQNAQNAHTNIVIYHGTGNKELADMVVEDIDEKYGTQSIEESQEVVQKYDVDIVIALGS
jgi:LysM repeat protein